MDENQIKENLKNTLNEIRKKTSNFKENLNEANTESTIIEPILRTLGWDTSTQSSVYKQYPVGSGKADYGLFHNGQLLMLIEAKPPDVELEEKFKQLKGYIEEKETKLSALTNGENWWFYVYQRETGTFTLFTKIKMLKHEEHRILEKFYNFLSHKSVTEGAWQAYVDFELKDREKYKIIHDNLHIAWNRLIDNHPEDTYTPLMNSILKSICNIEADKKDIKEFFAKHKKDITIRPENEEQKAVEKLKRPQYKTLKHLYYKEEKIDISDDWKILARTIFEHIANEQKDKFSEFTLSEKINSKKIYFSKNSFTMSTIITGTDIHMNQDISDDQALKLIKSIIKELNYNDAFYVIYLRK